MMGTQLRAVTPQLIGTVPESPAAEHLKEQAHTWDVSEWASKSGQSLADIKFLQCARRQKQPIKNK
jgi:hypothetical protein